MQTGTFDENLWFAIAEPNRRRLIDILLNNGEASASKLAGQVAFSRQAVAKHMAVLNHAGLIRQHRAGKEVRFMVDPSGVSKAAKELSAAAAAWDGRLHKIKEISEAIGNGKELV